MVLFLRYYDLYSVLLQHNLGIDRLVVDDSRPHTPGRTPLNERSACRDGRYLHNTQQTYEV